MITINSKLSKLFIGKNIISRCLSGILTKEKLFVIVDKHLFPFIKPVKEFSTVIYCDYFSEDKKNVKSVLKMLSLLLKYNVKKNDYVVIIGGGALLDTAGFASSIFKRGLQVINIPTTFLSMIDSAIGGKNGINYNGIKNIIGTITQPKYVIIDLSFLGTEQVKQGLGELLKYAMIGDFKLYTFIYNNHHKIINCDMKIIEKLIYKCVKVKLSIVEKDPFDNSIRHILNFGHTIGHFIESISGYSISHSDAVILGLEIEMLCCNEQFGIVSQKFMSYFYNLLKAFSIERKKIPQFTKTQFKQIITLDKKAESKNFITISCPVDFNRYELSLKIPFQKVYNVLKRYAR
ncbi:MAG: 3-dehydroquinate synthase family protein [Planctomycetota bacterium]